MLNKLGIKLIDYWYKPQDVVRWDCFRFAIATALLAYVMGRWSHAHEWLTNAGFHITPDITFKYSDFALPTLPPELLILFGFVMIINVFCVIIGFRVHITAWLTLICFFYASFADFTTLFSPNKWFMLTILLVALSPNGQYLRIEKRGSGEMPSWPITVVQMCIILHYFAAGVTKITVGNWLEDPYILLSQMQGIYRTDFAVFLLEIMPRGAWPLMQYSALAFELSAPLIFGIRKLRPIGFLWGFTFQTIVAISMSQLIYFSFQMLCFYIVFIDPKYLHAFLNFISGKKKLSAAN